MKSFFIKLMLCLLAVSYLSSAEEEKTVHLADNVAAYNDWLLEKGQTNPLLKPLTAITARTLSITLFPLFTAADMALLTAKQAQEIPYILLSKNSEAHKAKYRKNAEAFKSSTIALLASPMGIISPDVVTHHFVPSNIKTFHLTPYGKLYQTRAHMVYPETAADVQSIILEAKRSGKTVSTVGKFMSQGKQAISNNEWNVVLNAANLNWVEINPLLKQARVGAGASWADLQREANHYGLAVRVMQASNIFSIGGSISANCHGWDHNAGCLRNTIISLTIVDPSGGIQVITHDDPLFDYVFGGYGGFGMIVEAQISLADNVEMIEHGVEVPPEGYLAYFNELIRNNDAIDMHLYRLSLDPKHLFKTGIAVNYQRISDEPVVANLVDEPKQGSRLDRIKIHALRRLPWVRNLAWNTEKQQALSSNLSSRNELMRPIINPVFNDSNIDTEWLQEYFVKGEDLPEFLHFLGNILQSNNVALFNASVRFVKQDIKTKLSYALKGDRFAIVLFFNQKLSEKEVLKTKKWVREVIDYLVAHDGSYYLPYQHFATKDQFRACYPNWESVVAYKHMLDPQSVFDNGLYADYLTHDQHHSLLRKVFNRVNGQREGIRDFLNHIFMQLDEERFFSLVDKTLENPNLDDDQIYRELYNNIGQAQTNALSKLKSTLNSLSTLKQDLGDQTAELVGKTKIKGYVEIGYPGRMTRPLKSRLQILKPFYVITDKESLSDYVEAGFPRPYDEFITLNDYVPIPEDKIGTASVDLVCLYIGLHHIPEAQLDPFIDSIKRILRPGGTFILMDHDAYTDELKNMVNVVHSIFNVATGVTPELNQQEVRNFQSLKYWIDRLAAHGMVHYDYPPLIRKGDSTLNSLVRFNKPLETTDQTIVETFNSQPNYTRPQEQTYLTAPEWQNVRAAQAYAAFVEHEPAYRYPYFSEIGGFWKVYGQSFRSAQEQTGFANVALSEYNLMNLFVGTTMTLEYGAKGIIAAPFSLIDQTLGNNRKVVKSSPLEQERIRSLKDYGNYIESTPFYQYPYFKDIGSYWSTYLNKTETLGSSIKGFFLGAGMTLEYGLKGIIAAPMSWVYGSETFKEAETLHLLVYDPENRIESIDSSIVVIENYPEHKLKHIETPRYLRFTEIVQKMAAHPSLACINIAGHDKIQFDVKSLNPTLPQSSLIRELYTIPTPTEQGYTFTALEVNVNQLCEAIRYLNENKVEIVFVHDF